MTIKCIDNNETWAKMDIVNTSKPSKVYLVSDKGRVMEYNPKNVDSPFYLRVDTNIGRFTKGGYRELRVSNKYYKVHRLVATYFIEDNLASKLHVHHINGVPDDNRACNLQWVTAKEHLAIEIGEGKKKPVYHYNYYQRRYKWKDICDMRFLHEGQGWSVSQLAGLYDMSIKAMRRILNHEYYKAP